MSQFTDESGLDTVGFAEQTIARFNFSRFESIFLSFSPLMDAQEWLSGPQR